MHTPCIPESHKWAYSLRNDYTRQKEDRYRVPMTTELGVVGSWGQPECASLRERTRCGGPVHAALLGASQVHAGGCTGLGCSGEQKESETEESLSVKPFTQMIKHAENNAAHGSEKMPIKDLYKHARWVGSWGWWGIGVEIRSEGEK